MKKKRLVVPYSAADDATSALDSLLSDFSAGTSEDDYVEDDPAEDDVDEGDEGGEGEGGDGDGDQSNPQDANQVSDNTRKANEQFARMRIANKQLTQLLGKLATANGIEYANTNELISKLNDSALQQISQKSNVPVELLKEVESLRADSEMLRQQQAQTRLTEGFKTLMNEYSLDEKELRTFCSELDGAGVDVSAHGFDVVGYYKMTHMDDIIQKRVAAEVAKALNKDAVADAHSTAPVQRRGSRGGTPKVSSMASLDALLKDFPDTK